VERTLKDAGAYYTAPLRWNGRNWEYFGGALAAIAIAHHYDSQVRTHFDRGSSLPLGPKNSGSLTDALPGAALFLGTWGYATLIGSHTGESEAWNMLESGGLSFVSAYALKYIVRRPRPDATTNSNHFFGGGDSFPSEHVTAAFAVGTVLAESGNPEFRWIRRTIGYGVGIGTAYLRMKHNAHWLSDTVAGAALGMATAHFVMGRSKERDAAEDPELSIVPVQGGMMLAFSANFSD
jgi:membrane-associated phospholipid phosphatase